jgi:hypothetical protein
MQILEVSDAVGEEFLSLFELAPHEDQFCVAEVEPDEIGALVGQDCIVVRAEFEPAVLDQAYFVAQLPRGKNFQHIPVRFFLLDQDVTFLVDGLHDYFVPFVLLTEVLDANR